MADKDHPPMKVTCKVEVAAETKGTATGNIKLSGTAQPDVDCYDYCEVKVPITESAADCVRITVQPSAADQIALLVIASDTYAAELSYSPSKEAAYADRLKLTTIHTFLPGSVLFSSADQANYLYFWNTTENPACIHIFVGRKGMGKCQEDAEGDSTQTPPADEDEHPAEDGDEPKPEPKKPYKPTQAQAAPTSGRKGPA